MKYLGIPYVFEKRPRLALIVQAFYYNMYLKITRIYLLEVLKTAVDG
ncbi:hypothetical protein ACEQPO_26860 [Bacillus sp. SL00103]